MLSSTTCNGADKPMSALEQPHVPTEERLLSHVSPTYGAANPISAILPIPKPLITASNLSRCHITLSPSSLLVIFLLDRGQHFCCCTRAQALTPCLKRGRYTSVKVRLNSPGTKHHLCLFPSRYARRPVSHSLRLVIEAGGLASSAQRQHQPIACPAVAVRHPVVALALVEVVLCRFGTAFVVVVPWPNHATASVFGVA